MRLINTETLKLHEFPYGEIPPYAILSHTWGSDEVTFQDMSSTEHRQKKSFKKVVDTCSLASQQGLKFAWVDTCCIDKSSSAELTEAINSMYQWYKNSMVCYAYIEDLCRGDSIEKLRDCRWVTRGWTLQELIAPATVEFYDEEWKYRGSKTEHAGLVSDSTGVPSGILIGKRRLEACSVAARMSWVARRQTTRPEDIAYCMLGIFGANMPLLYGEGLMAFRRLQEEILHRNNDITILAWGRQRSQEQVGCTGVLAASASDFLGSGSISPFPDDSDSISITNKGLLVSGDIPIRIVIHPGRQGYQYMVCLGRNSDSEDCMEGLTLRKIGPNSFYRIGVGSLPGQEGAVWNPNSGHFQEVVTLDYTDFYLLIDPKNPVDQASRYREHGIHFPHDPIMSIISVTPQTLWDATDRIFLRRKPYTWHHPIPQVLGLLVDYYIDGHPVKLAVFCDYEAADPKCGLRLLSTCSRKLLRAFNVSNILNSILWPESEDDSSESKEGHRYVDVSLGSRTVRISVVLKNERPTRGARGSDIINESDALSSLEFHRFSVRLGWREIDGSSTQNHA